jgi:tetratricopeptide (TPR) repeat protein
MAEAWFNLGYMMNAIGRHSQAMEAYRKSLIFGISRPEEVHLNIAAIYSDHLRLDDEAERELKQALAIAPEFASALLNLGNLQEERGERESAVICYQSILSSDSGGTAGLALRQNALARLLQLQPPKQLDDPLLQSAISSAKAGPPESRANLLFALGRMYDSLSLYDPAFDAFRDANTQARINAVPYNPSAQEKFVDGLINNPVSIRTDGHVTPQQNKPSPLFICGMFRSGSTLVEQILASHPAVSAGGEIDYLPRLASGLKPLSSSLVSLSGDAAASAATGYIKRLFELLPDEGKTYITDKRCDNFLLIGLIKRLFPSAKIIHTKRHPMDNALSIFMQHMNLRVTPYASDLREIGHYYAQYRRLMSHWNRIHEDSIFDFDYDAFVRKPETELKRLLAFLELPWDSRCLDFHQLKNTVKTASYWQVRKPLYAESSGRWRNYAGHLAPLRQVLEENGIKP